ncbi:MAG: molybdate ABC transporter substrate-binding protein [Bacteroidota bacterium]
MKKTTLIILIIFFTLAGNLFSQSVSIAATADLRFVMDELILDFNKTCPEIKVEVIYGSSGNLVEQIVNKAPFNIFFSADVVYARKLDSLKLTSSKPKVYAIGHLVLWSSKLDVSKGVELLTSPEVKHIAIANPAFDPYGKRAVEFLKFNKIDRLVKDKIVEGENVSQAAQFALVKNADVGIIALSLALSAEMRTKGKHFPIDETNYSKLEQAYVILKSSSHPKEIAKFVQYLETQNARRIFGKYGFRLPVVKK